MSSECDPHVITVLARSLSACLFAAAAVGCGSPLSQPVSEQHLAVGGYVTIGTNPAYGVVTLVTPEEIRVIATRIDNGRYEVSWPVEGGTAVCAGYYVLVSIEEDRARRTEIVRLDATTGACTMPYDATLAHRVNVDFAAQSPAVAPD